jgi:hypothetical protein
MQMQHPIIPYNGDGHFQIDVLMQQDIIHHKTSMALQNAE